MQCHTRLRLVIIMSASPAPGGMDAEEDGARPSVVVVESDSAGPSATVTEVRNMVVLESKSERSRRLATLRKRKQTNTFTAEEKLNKWREA